MFEKLPFGGQLALMAVLAIVLVGLAYFVWPNISQTREDIAAARDTLEQKQTEVRRGQAAERRLPELEREIVNLQRQLTDIAQILPRDTETGDLLRWIKNNSDESNLDLKSFSPGGLRPVEFYKEFPIEMQVTGKYHDLGLFLDRVANYTRIINVDKLTMSANTSEAGKTISAEFTATTFVYNESPTASAEEGVQ